jgi:hypothetical protein
VSTAHAASTDVVPPGYIRVLVRGDLDAADPHHAAGNGSLIREIPGIVRLPATAPEETITLQPPIPGIQPAAPLVIDRALLQSALSALNAGGVVLPVSGDQAVVGAPTLVLEASPHERGGRMPIERILIQGVYLQPGPQGDMTAHQMEIPLRDFQGPADLRRQELDHRALIAVSGEKDPVPVTVVRVEAAPNRTPIRFEGPWARDLPKALGETTAWVVRRGEVGSSGPVRVFAVPAYALSYDLRPEVYAARGAGPTGPLSSVSRLAPSAASLADLRGWLGAELANCPGLLGQLTFRVRQGNGW